MDDPSGPLRRSAPPLLSLIPKRQLIMTYFFGKQMNLAVCFLITVSGSAGAEVQDPTGIKRAFLDRYLACAEAPGDAARLECYDALLMDIPAWLDDASDSTEGAAPSWSEQPVQASQRRDGCSHTRSAD
ncbi:hypothetical protein ABWH93_19555 [Seohaeicola saemankumensis]|uniref:hypothetical protein n=1 Tax=Seohaeicola TaxID=481178 RepID=UPI0035D08361